MSAIREWVIVGCRRWAYVNLFELEKVLLESQSLPERVTIVVDDTFNVLLKKQLSESRFAKVVRVSNEIPVALCGDGPSVGLVLNSAYLHAGTIEELLSKGFNVVTEKPISFSNFETDRLLKLASTLHLKIFGTNTMAFSGVTKHLSVVSAEVISTIKITWTDPQSEYRQGIEKKYDSSTPVVCDVLPHIASLVYELIGPAKLKSHRCDVRRGGALVFLKLLSKSEITIELLIARNADSRQRKMVVNYGKPIGEEISIDFANFPNVRLAKRSDKGTTTELLKHSRMPIREMLRSVVKALENDKLDSRLSIDHYQYGDYLISLVLGKYVEYQIRFLKKLENSQEVSSTEESDRLYAETEIHAIRNRVLPVLKYAGELDRLRDFSIPLWGESF